MGELASGRNRRRVWGVVLSVGLLALWVALMALRPTDSQLWLIVSMTIGIIALFSTYFTVRQWRK